MMPHENDVYELPVENMKDIDWTRVDEKNAASFGLALSFADDAVKSLSVSQGAVLSSLASLLASLLVALGVGWFSTDAALAGVMGVLSINVVLDWLRVRRSRKLVAEAMDELKDESDKLAAHTYDK